MRNALYDGRPGQERNATARCQIAIASYGERVREPVNAMYRIHTQGRAYPTVRVADELVSERSLTVNPRAGSRGFG
jgi:hypothetical protein